MSIILHKMPSKPYKLRNASLASESQLTTGGLKPTDPRKNNQFTAA